MCGRFIIFSEAEEREFRDIVEEVDRKYGEDSIKKDAEIFPTDVSPVVTYNEGLKDVNLFKWGFPNFKGGSVIINARCETLLDRPMFREAFRSNRCLIPATAFFEWKKTSDGKKEKYIISSSDSSFFYMAGLYKDFKDKEGKPYKGFVIITTSAGSKMSQIHERMPVMLMKRDEIEMWADSSFNDLSKLDRLLSSNDNILIKAT